MKKKVEYLLPPVVNGFSWAYTFYLIEKLKELLKKDKVFVNGNTNAKRLDERRYTKKEMQNVNRHAFCLITPISVTVIRKIMQQTEMPPLVSVTPDRSTFGSSNTLTFCEVTYIINTAEEFLAAFPPPQKDP